MEKIEMLQNKRQEVSRIVTVISDDAYITPVSPTNCENSLIMLVRMGALMVLHFLGDYSAARCGGYAAHTYSISECSEETMASKLRPPLMYLSH